ncbi:MULTISPECIES: YARHG domain-containing protein [unclassified Ruminococcus]|uniref:YARHG domain-containing protein n=1 Tax=unclassified Ruminococcus TaxID=2608920 RepID=UPI00210BA3FC|nr:MULTISPECIES: YARHG domain-containing protein [unclassified Ruminococcus]MCQ4021591.1 YARHG domain-containing protein [Ruminococcus sp. zg-924]MCQ4114036.1 YARHG domain-containing protein [Ruminococcus sp. zg-921]
MKCTNCNRDVENTAKFCPNCGTKLAVQEEKTEIFSNSEFAPYAPGDIDEFGNEKPKKHKKALAAIIIIGAILITAMVVFAAVVLGNTCTGGSATKTSDASSTAPTAPSTATKLMIELPDACGKTQQQATEELESLGFNVSIIKQNSDTVESGYVINQSPRAGNTAEAGAAVILSVSIGPEVTQAETDPETETETETETASNPTQIEKTISTYIIPDSNTRYLDYSDLEGIDGDRLVLARNEIYARHGRLFDSKELQDYFDKCTWYNGTIAPNDFNESTLNKYERANIDFILQKELSAR